MNSSSLCLFKDDYRQTIRTSTPLKIASQQSNKSYPSALTNGHSRSMDFHSATHINKPELVRPTVLSHVGTIYENSSSSIATLTSVRSSASLEFDDDAKPSGVLVDDDFLPMSSPVDEQFWDTVSLTQPSKTTNSGNECFPNVGSSPDVEKKQFHLHAAHSLTSSLEQPLSETSCDDDDDDDPLLNQQKFSVHEYQLRELQKATVSHRSTPEEPPPPIINNHKNGIPVPVQRLGMSLAPLDAHPSLHVPRLVLDQAKDESLLERFALCSGGDSVHSPPLRSSLNAEANYPQTIYEEDDTQDSSTNDNVSDESADNGEIDLVREFELSQERDEHPMNTLWTTNDRDIFILQEDDLISALVTTPTQQQSLDRPRPPSIMKIIHPKSIDSSDEQTTPPMTTTATTLKPKVRFNLDPQYEREREWNKVNKLLGNSVEWTDEFEV